MDLVEVGVRVNGGLDPIRDNGARGGARLGRAKGIYEEESPK